jgi:hypothetical protein
MRNTVSELTYQRIDLAKEQLDVALELFLSQRSLVSALTLAGAAEEILGKELSRLSEECTLQHEYSMIAPVQELLHRRRYSWKDFIDEKNRVRNAAKHMGNASELSVYADLEDQALRMLVRACDNYRRLALNPTPRMEEFDAWFWKNVLGTDDYV